MALTYEQRTINLGPIGYWRFGEFVGVTSLDEISTNDGTYLNAPMFGATGVTIDSDTAISLDGINQYVSFPSILPTGNTPKTIEIWVKPTTTFITELVACAFGDDVVGGAMSITLDATGINFNTFGGGVNDTHVPYAYVPNELLYLVFSYNGTDLRGYINGVEAFTQTIPVLSSGNAYAYIGASSTISNFFNGVVDEFAVYNYAIDALTIESTYAVYTGGFVPYNTEYFSGIVSEQLTRIIDVNWGQSTNIENNPLTNNIIFNAITLLGVIELDMVQSQQLGTNFRYVNSQILSHIHLPDIMTTFHYPNPYVDVLLPDITILSTFMVPNPYISIEVPAPTIETMFHYPNPFISTDVPAPTTLSVFEIPNVYFDIYTPPPTQPGISHYPNPILDLNVPLPSEITLFHYPNVLPDAFVPDQTKIGIFHYPNVYESPSVISWPEPLGIFRFINSSIRPNPYIGGILVVAEWPNAYIDINFDVSSTVTNFWGYDAYIDTNTVPGEILVQFLQPHYLRRIAPGQENWVGCEPPAPPPATPVDQYWG